MDVATSVRQSGTSVGWMLDCDRFTFDPHIGVQQEWDALCERFPSISEQLCGTQVVAPESGTRRIPILQSELRAASGPYWALLPAAIGFADPLYSTGIAHALTCAQRLSVALSEKPDSLERTERLQRYGSQVLSEVGLIDRLISLAYRTSGHFETYVAMTMLYFAASTVSEMASKAVAGSGENVDQTKMAFLLADHHGFISIVDQVNALVQAAEASGDWQHVARSVQQLLEPFNHVGLFQPDQPRMYRYTSAK